MTGYIILPSIKGFFGDWVYYNCTVPVDVLVKHVCFAKDMYAEKPKWSEMLQREIKDERGNEIAKYLTSSDRFFNSLVVGVYAGSPEWLDIKLQKTDLTEDIEISEETNNKFGLLKLSGKEKLYALDGQHRLLGMKVALEQGVNIHQDDVPVIFVSIGSTREGELRARRLFSTINKKAISVGLGAKIALDEDDSIAIITRKLVDTGDLFNTDSIVLKSTTALPSTEKNALTTAGNLYDIVKILLVEYVKRTSKRKQGILKQLTDGKRPSPDVLDGYYTYIFDYFKTLAELFQPFNDYISAIDKGSIVFIHRGKGGGHILFRPFGLKLMATLFTECKGATRERLTLLRQYLPTELDQFPYAKIIWDNRTGNIIKGGDKFPRLVHLCRYMLGFKLNKLQERSMIIGLSDIQGVPPEDVAIPLKWIEQ